MTDTNEKNNDLYKSLTFKTRRNIYLVFNCILK